MTDWRGTTLYSYDALGRLLKTEGPESNEKISYAYDALGNRVSMTNQDGQLANYTYDALNRLITVIDEQGPTYYSFDALSNITKIVYPNGASIDYSYDVMDRPLLVVNKDAKNKKADVFGYVYDLAGMVTKIMQEGGVFEEYRYDALNRLMRKTKKSFGFAQDKQESSSKKQEAKIKYDHQYSYDAVGNRVELIKHKDGEDSKQIKETYSYDAGNRLLGLTRDKEKDGLPVLVEAVHYGYDNNGNRMVKEESKFDDDEQEPAITYYGYDHENRLTSLEYVGDEQEETDILNASFEYAGNGIRRKAVEGDVITRYYHDGLNVIFEKDASGFTKKAYTHGLGFPGGIGGLISMKRYEMEENGLEEMVRLRSPQETHYYHYDALGSVRSLSNQDGRLSAEFDYDAFGNELKHKGDEQKNAYRFSSKEFEDHAGLYYFGERYYDPEIGRWLTQDPLRFLDGFNVYAYVRNDPLNWIDPWGLNGERSNDGIEAVPLWEDPIFISLAGVRAVLAAYRTAKFAREALNVQRTGANFFKKAPRSANNFNIKTAPDGSTTFSYEVTGRVPGSKAIYQKTVDSAGKTIDVIKTTYDPKGEIIHIKDKLIVR